MIRSSDCLDEKVNERGMVREKKSESTEIFIYFFFFDKCQIPGLRSSHCGSDHEKKNAIALRRIL